MAENKKKSPDFYRIDLHESITLRASDDQNVFLVVIRVPGRWIYVDSSGGIFYVPYDEEFKNKEK